MSARTTRAVVIVLDGVGCGSMQDAADYGDTEADTLGNVAAAVGGLRVPNLERLGLGSVTRIAGVAPRVPVDSWWGRMRELSPGKDTTTGHWEMMGIRLEKPFPTYPDGFPDDLMRRFSTATGRGFLGNTPASGTAVIQRFGDEHVRTGDLIVYTSADSVFQIAAHEDVVPVEELYRICEVARGLLVDEHAVARVIARPFVGGPGDEGYVRTHRRRDFAVPPFGPTAIDVLGEAGIPTYGVGKIGEIFAWKGIHSSPHTTDDMHGVDTLLERLDTFTGGFHFVNLVDFDMRWGHRNDVRGFASGLELFDARIPEIEAALSQGDLLVITADHGCDPTTASTDHSREVVPLLAYVVGGGTSGSLLERSTFSDVGATVLEHFGVAHALPGRSFRSVLSA